MWTNLMIIGWLGPMSCDKLAWLRAGRKTTAHGSTLLIMKERTAGGSFFRANEWTRQQLVGSWWCSVIHSSSCLTVSLQLPRLTGQTIEKLISLEALCNAAAPTACNFRARIFELVNRLEQQRQNSKMYFNIQLSTDREQTIDEVASVDLPNCSEYI